MKLRGRFSLVGDAIRFCFGGANTNALLQRRQGLVQGQELQEKRPISRSCSAIGVGFIGNIDYAQENLRSAYRGVSARQ